MEFILYFILWICAVFYSIFRFYQQSQYYFRYYKDEYFDFDKGWEILSRKKDVADSEWEIIKFVINEFYGWIILTIFVSEILRRNALFKVLRIWYIILPIVVSLITFGLWFVIFILVQPIFFFLTRNIHTKFVVWCCSTLSLGFITAVKYCNHDTMVIFNLNEKEAYVLILCLFWMNLRCLSYSLDNVDEKTTFIVFMSYCLYLPTLFLGPFISFEDFKGTFEVKGGLKRRILVFCMEVFRFLFWVVFTEFWLHFIYVNAAGFQPEWVESLDSWSLYGYGYTMGQFFHLKYVVIYGLATSVAKFDHMKVPTTPICIGRVHLYSDMWKYFDTGLYSFLLKYIYLPTLNLFSNKLVSSLLCFAFVYIWHGISEDYIFIWAALNFVGILVENYFIRFSNKLIINTQWTQRIRCLCSSPLLIMSAISNFFFFAKVDIGVIFVRRIFSDSLWKTSILIASLYCCCQVSTEFRRDKRKRD